MHSGNQSREVVVKKEAFELTTLDLTSDDTCKELSEFITENMAGQFYNRFTYSMALLRWALCQPDFIKGWHIGVRAKDTNILYGFIGAVPETIYVRGERTKTAHVRLFCVVREFRKQGLGTRMMKELTKRVGLEGVRQAVYATDDVLKTPDPMAEVSYQYRMLNPKKLIQAGFKEIRAVTRSSMYEKLYRLEAAPKTPGFREMMPDDCWQVESLLSQRLGNSNVVVDACFDGKDIGALLLPREGVFYSYVVENPDTGVITDFTSFFTAPSTLADNNGDLKTVHHAYSYYNAAIGTKFTDLLNDTLISAKNQGMDNFFILDIKQPTNENYLEVLKFAKGVNEVQSFLYLHDPTSLGDDCPLDPSKIGLVMW